MLDRGKIAAAFLDGKNKMLRRSWTEKKITQLA
jgi:hypothetical protein